MPIAFTKLTNGNVKIDNNGQIGYMHPSANVFASQRDDFFQIFDGRDRWEFAFQLVAVPLLADRDLLIAELATNFFYDAGAGSATGAQDVNVVNDPLNTQLVNNGEAVSVQNPFPVDGFSIHPNDVDFDNSSAPGWSGDLADLFTSPFSASLSYAAGAAPDPISIAFNRTQFAQQIGVGSNNATGWAGIKITATGSFNTSRSIIDESGDPTTQYSRNYRLEKTEGFNGLLLEFNTDQGVSLTNLTIQKSRYGTQRIEGRRPSGEYTEAKLDDQGNLVTAITPQDIFGNVPISEQYGLWDNSRVFSYAAPLFWSDFVSGTASNTYDKATSKNTLAVEAGGVIATQTKSRRKYQPLKAHKTATTCVAEPEAGVSKYFGLFDLDNYDEPTISSTIQNGVPFCVTGDGASVQLWNNGSLEVEVGQANWNIDPLDGTGPSGYVLDLQYAQIGVTEIEWLGVGACLFVFNIDGKNIPIHKINNANRRIKDVYMRTANLPICYMVVSTGGAGSMKVICNAIVSGGGHNPLGVPRVASTAGAVAVASGDTEALLFIRLKPEAYEASVNIRGISGNVVSSGDAEYKLHFNPVWDGGALTWADVPNSHIQIAQNNNNEITDAGVVMELNPVSSDSDAFVGRLVSRLQLGKNLQANANQEGRYDVIALTGNPYTSNESFYGNIHYEDIF